MELSRAPQGFKLQVTLVDGSEREAFCYYAGRLPVGRAVRFIGLFKRWQRLAEGAPTLDQVSDPDALAEVMEDMLTLILTGITPEEIRASISLPDAMQLIEASNAGDIEAVKKKTNLTDSPPTSAPASSTQD